MAKICIERQASLLQSDGPKKSNIQVRPPPGNKSIRAVIQRFDGIERAELAPRVDREFEFCLDPPCHDGLMISVMYNQRRPSGKTGGKLGLEPGPGHGGLHQPGVVLGIASIGKACGRKGTFALKLSRRDQSSVVRAVIEISQRIQKARRCIASNPFHVRAECCFQKQRIGICRFESTDIEGRLKIICENSFADTN